MLLKLHYFFVAVKLTYIKTFHCLMHISHTVKESMKLQSFNFWLSLQHTDLPEMGRILKIKRSLSS